MQARMRLVVRQALRGDSQWSKGAPVRRTMAMADKPKDYEPAREYTSLRSFAQISAWQRCKAYLDLPICDLVSQAVKTVASASHNEQSEPLNTAWMRCPRRPQE